MLFRHNERKKTTLIVYVDSIIVAIGDVNEINCLKNQLGIVFDVKYLG